MNEIAWHQQYIYKFVQRYYGEIEILTILKEKGFEEGKNPAHIEPAIITEIHVEIQEINDNFKNMKEEITCMEDDISSIKKVLSSTIDFEFSSTFTKLICIKCKKYVLY